MSSTLIYSWDFLEPCFEFDLLLEVLEKVDDKKFVIVARHDAADHSSLINWEFSKSLDGHYIYNPGSEGGENVQLKKFVSTAGIDSMRLEISAWKESALEPREIFGECWVSTPFRPSSDKDTPVSTISIAERTVQND
ncbi:hypothetical protein [Arthrobacter sp. L77]|uniref:hypothetical protein n=1 Tax=Arthrobacter sp. L77 TaxID=1496689 RepID=UPI0012E0B2D9|nr:hypothetical protein [Arthrobacter sp. L77]